MYILLLAAVVVRGQLDGLRSRIRFPPQLPGRHVVWEGHPRVGLGNVLAGWGDLYYKAIDRDKTILVGLDHAIGDRTKLDRANAMGHSRAVPYLDWWALANSQDIVVRRHAGCIAQASTFSTTARAWGLDVERAARRARPDFDGLV